MGVYATYVILRSDTSHWREDLAHAMEPFDLLKEVDPWRKPVAHYALRWMLEQVGRADLRACLDAARDDRLPAELVEIFLENGPHLFGPRPTGTEVGLDDQGRPWELTAENPLGTWDSWVIGDRFDGTIVHEEGPWRENLSHSLPPGNISSGGYMGAMLRIFGAAEPPAGKNDPVLARNIERVSVLADAVRIGSKRMSIPFAVVTPEPVWHEGVEGRWHSAEPVGRMPWRPRKSSWAEAVEALYAQYSDHLAVCLACHQ